MFKNILLSTVLCATLSAQSFEIFLQNSIKNSPYLKANSLSIAQANERAGVTTRYENPILSIEASNFSSDVGRSEVGYRAAISQPIRLWGISANRKDFANTQTSEAKSLVTLNRANLVANLSLLYIDYKSSVNVERLAEEELLISQKISLISKEHYENGTIARVKYIQAKLDASRVENTLNERKAATITTYYALLGLAGANEEVDIETAHKFVLSSNNSLENSAEIDYLKKQGLRASAEAELNANKLEWINLYGEFEQEPDQDIARVGVDIPLIFFNTKSEEKRIAKLQAKKLKLLTTNISNTRTMKLREIEKSLSVLDMLSRSTQILLASQQELLSMYEDAYKEASVNLIELQIIKNQMILTKEKAIIIKRQQEQKIVEHNLLTGEYND